MNHVYRMYDGGDRLLYVGKSIAWGTRMGQHQSREWFLDVAYMTLMAYDTEEEALRAEREAIRSERPLHNVVHSTVEEIRSAAAARSRRVRALRDEESATRASLEYGLAVDL